MVSDEQVRRLLKLRKREKTLATAAAKAGMDEKTARKWLGSEKLPSQRKIERCWRTRADPFSEVWSEIEEILELCADTISSQLVSGEDVAAMLAKSILMFPYYPAREEFVFRLAMIQEQSRIREEIEATAARSSELPSQDTWNDCP
jgi:hypothetical protein